MNGLYIHKNYDARIINTVDNREGIYLRSLSEYKSDWNVFHCSVYPYNIIRYCILLSDRQCDSTICHQYDAYFIFAVENISTYVHQLWQDFWIYTIIYVLRLLKNMTWLTK